MSFKIVDIIGILFMAIGIGSFFLMEVKMKKNPQYNWKMVFPIFVTGLTLGVLFLLAF